MTGKEILKSFYKLVHTYYNLNIPDFDLQVDDDLWQNDEIIDELKGDALLIALPKIHELLEAFKEVKIGSDYLVNEYQLLENVELIDFAHIDFRKRNRAFSYSDVEFGYLALSKLLLINPLSSIDETSQDYRTLIDFISTAIANGQDGKISTLLTHIQNLSEDWGILIHKIAHGHSSLSIYSYIYYKELLQGGKIELNPVLNYTALHGAAAVLRPGTRYEQYFEVFDIINELNHASDTITRFLKLYHIIEYLVYRRELVEIEQKARNNRTFIREIHSFTGKGQSESEINILKKNFKKIFEAEIAGDVFDLNPLNGAEAHFLKTYWGINVQGAGNRLSPREGDTIVNLIYRIRNSIVHNKESEFHITTTNPDDYSDVLDLIKRFITILERQLLDKISTDAAVISYQNQNIQLY
jgi:hypothetical protein